MPVEAEGTVPAEAAGTGQKKPAWLRSRLPSGGTWANVEDVIARHGLNTVCDEARCPNKAECWGGGTATFMIMGDVCTRGCSFCAVSKAPLGQALRPREPEDLAAAVVELGLRYAVLTSVDRDDLEDRGAAHFAACVRAIKAAGAGTAVEVLIPDYGPAEIPAVAASAPDVVAHNVETVRSLQCLRDARASFDQSLETLRLAKAAGVSSVKSSLMLGLGERPEEVEAAMSELRGVGTDILVLGQYLRPGFRQTPVVEYLEPAAFDAYAAMAQRMGFAYVVSSPLARTSYKAMEAFTAGNSRNALGSRE
jgi:lipoic acid synthetase